MSDFPELRVGVDNGISGALAILAGKDLLSWLPMPIQKTRKGNEVDILAVWEFIEKHVPSQQMKHLLIVIEEPGGSKSAVAAASMSGSFHALRAMCALKKVRWLRITPQSWQKKMLKCKPGDTKPAALALVRQLWPEERWLATPRCSTPHDGGIDASLIAEFARRENL